MIGGNLRSEDFSTTPNGHEALWRRLDLRRSSPQMAVHPIDVPICGALGGEVAVLLLGSGSFGSYFCILTWFRKGYPSGLST